MVDVKFNDFFLYRLAATCSEAASAVTGGPESILNFDASSEAKARCEGLWHILDDLTIDGAEESSAATESNLLDLLGDTDDNLENQE